MDIVLSNRMRVKKLPKLLALHLKRFKYNEAVQKYSKLSYRVVFPLELRLFNTVSDVYKTCNKQQALYFVIFQDNDAVVISCLTTFFLTLTFQVLKKGYNSSPPPPPRKVKKYSLAPKHKVRRVF